MTRWVGVDGEGVGRMPHRYILLAHSDANGRGASLVDERGLSTTACLDYLLGLGSHHTRVVGYYLGYDWTMILRDLPDKAIYALLRPELRATGGDEGGAFAPVRWGRYRLNYLNGCMRVSDGKRRVTVWDAGRFFQSSFVEALMRWQSQDLTFPELDRIARMKAARSDFSAENRAEIERYCQTECQYLARLMSAFESELDHLEIKMRSWYGPGSVAKSVMRAHGIPDHLAPVDARMSDLADRAFFGGRFESSTQGPVDDVYGHDIVSAYPYQTLGLPCLACGTWREITRERDLPRESSRATRALVRYTLRDIGDRPWGPLPCRLPDGTIIYPRGGSSGWVWCDEYRAAKAAYGKSVRFGGAIVYTTRCDHAPFAFVRDFFAERIRVGKTGRGIALKLSLNSIYGSLAQRAGRSRYASSIWAGMITSGTRATLLRAISRAPDRVLAVATDGIYTRGDMDLEGPPLADSTLGSWESERHGSVMLVRPGIYWDLDGPTMRSRGLPRRHMAEHRAAAESALERGLARADLGHTTTFGGAKACVYRIPATREIRRSKLYGEWHHIPARIDLTPAPKRAEGYALHALPGVESAPYRASSAALSRLTDLHWADLE